MYLHWEVDAFEIHRALAQYLSWENIGTCRLIWENIDTCRHNICLVNHTQLRVPLDFDVSVALSTFHHFQLVKNTVDFHFLLHTCIQIMINLEVT